jgi:hypothetical protein
VRTGTLCSTLNDSQNDVLDKEMVGLGCGAKDFMNFAIVNRGPHGENVALSAKNCTKHEPRTHVWLTSAAFRQLASKVHDVVLALALSCLLIHVNHLL